MKQIVNIISRITVICILPCLVCCSCDSTSTLPPPSTGGGSGTTETDMTALYEYVRSYQTAYIRSLQLPSGAIKDNETGSLTLKNQKYLIEFVQNSFFCQI